ncbi:ferrochelatase [Bacillaceae bacterium SIJ1]|uniref:ferrochelatase n=1 Tax=Litoribacterium kuwaitense TaxID=1398745 RepID=UPI0013EDD6A5|nr:ferrochelatase [Litoribacterium kuwaitense]NGP44653.1 ferrochelatase [Litoribacterium kuwaitense]
MTKVRGLLLMGYGGPVNRAELETYYTHIHQGKKPSDAQVEEIRQKYDELGRCHPLAANSQRLAKAIEQQWNDAFQEELHVEVAYKHSFPFIEDAIQRFEHQGIQDLWTLGLNPLSSKTGLVWYQKRVQMLSIKASIQINVHHIEHWYHHPAVIHCMVDRLQRALQWLGNDTHPVVIFTAHSQPGTAANHSLYVQQLNECAASIGHQAELSTWRTAYRSLMTDRWLGPDFKDVMTEEKANGHEAIVVMDLLSLIENMEVMTDIHIEGQEHARDIGVKIVHTEYMNDSYDFARALFKVVQYHILNK